MIFCINKTCDTKVTSETNTEIQLTISLLKIQSIKLFPVITSIKYLRIITKESKFKVSLFKLNQT